MLGLLAGVAKLASPFIKKAATWAVTKATGKAGQAVGTAVTAVARSKAGRRIAKAGAGAVAAGGAFEVGGRVVRGSPGTTNTGAIQIGGPVMEGAGGMALPNGMTMHKGKFYVVGENGRRRRVTGMDPMGNVIYAKPSMNVLNPHALRRANRRLTGFGKFAKRTLNQLAKQSRGFAPRTVRGAKRIGGKKG